MSSDKKPTGISKVTAQFIGKVSFEPKRTPEGDLGIFVRAVALNKNRKDESVLIKLIVKGSLADKLADSVKPGDVAMIRGRNPALVQYREGVSPAFMMPCTKFKLLKDIESDIHMNISGHLAYASLDPSRAFSIIVVATSPYEGSEPVFYEARLFTENRFYVQVGRRVDMEVYDCVPFAHKTSQGVLTKRVHCTIGMLQLTDKRPDAVNQST